MEILLWIIFFISIALNIYLFLELWEIRNYNSLKVNSINDWLKEEIKQKRIYRKLVLALIKEKKYLIISLNKSLNKKDRVFKLLKNRNKSL